MTTTPNYKGWRVHGMFRGQAVIAHGSTKSGARAAWRRKADLFAKE